jgi:2-dehydropantoate 2-reductase
MRIAVVGAGGVGGYFGGRLAQGGLDVLPRLNATDDAASIGPVDVILVTVKSWQITEAIRGLRSLIHPTTAIIPLENGMTAPDDIAAVFGRDHALGGLCGIVSYIVAPGHVRHTAVDPQMMFGELDNRRSDRVTAIADAFQRAGVHAEVPPDIHRSMWTKVLFIAPYSAIGAASRVPIGVWRSMPQTRELAERLIHEMLSVAAARGVTLADDAFERTMERYDRLAADATPSLQRDVTSGRPSELEAQIGAVVHMGRESRTPVPLFEAIYALLLPQENAARGRS